MSNDAAAAQKAQSTDKLASLVADLFEQHHVALFNYIYQLVSDREWAHDLTQEVFLRLFRTRHRLVEVENHRAWTYRIATNLTFTALKRRRRFVWLPWHKEDDLHLSGEDPADEVAQRYAIEEALTQLPPKYRAPLILYGQYGFRIREVAAALNISESNAKVRLHRARKMFRLVYKGE